MKKIMMLIVGLLLVGCSKSVATIDEAVALAKENANLTDENSELVKSSYDDDKYFVELVDDNYVYRYVIDDDGKIESFVKEAKKNTEPPVKETIQEPTTTNATNTIGREEALEQALAYFGLTEDQVYEIEIDEDNLHTDRLVYKIDFETADTEYEIDVKADGTILNDKQERNNDKVTAFVSSFSRTDAIDAALAANGHNYEEIDELTLKQVVYFDQSYYEIEYEIGHQDYEMIVDANTLETRADN